MEAGAAQVFSSKRMVSAEVRWGPELTPTSPTHLVDHEEEALGQPLDQLRVDSLQVHPSRGEKGVLRLGTTTASPVERRQRRRSWCCKR